MSDAPSVSCCCEIMERTGIVEWMTERLIDAPFA